MTRRHRSGWEGPAQKANRFQILFELALVLVRLDIECVGAGKAVGGSA